MSLLADRKMPAEAGEEILKDSFYAASLEKIQYLLWRGGEFVSNSQEHQELTSLSFPHHCVYSFPLGNCLHTCTFVYFVLLSFPFCIAVTCLSTNSRHKCKSRPVACNQAPMFTVCTENCNRLHQNILQSTLFFYLSTPTQRLNLLMHWHTNLVLRLELKSLSKG